MTRSYRMSWEEPYGFSDAEAAAALARWDPARTAYKWGESWAANSPGDEGRKRAAGRAAALTYVARMVERTRVHIARAAHPREDTVRRTLRGKQGRKRVRELVTALNYIATSPDGAALYLCPECKAIMIGPTLCARHAAKRRVRRAKHWSAGTDPERWRARP